MVQTVGQLAERVLRRLGVALVPIADRPALTTMVPPATIATNALLELAVIASDETPSTADQALALAKVQQVQDSLASQALVWWSNDGVPRAVAEEYTKMAAAMLASSFGKQSDLGAYQTLEQRVRRMALILSAQNVAEEAIMAVHAQLEAQGLLRWSSVDIPDAVAEGYVIRAAAMLAPSFDKPADPMAEPQALRVFARYAALAPSGVPTIASYF